MNPYHDPHTGHFASKGTSSGANHASAPKKQEVAKMGGKTEAAGRSKAGKAQMKSLKREGNVSVRGGSSKPVMRVQKDGSLKEVGVKTVFSADSLKATLHRQVSKGAKSPYAAATIVTQRGSFQASVGKKLFHGGSVHSQSLNRPSIGKGFGMTPHNKR